MRLLGCALVAAAGAFMGLRAAARLRILKLLFGHLQLSSRSVDKLYNYRQQ